MGALDAEAANIEPSTENNKYVFCDFSTAPRLVAAAWADFAGGGEPVLATTPSTPYTNFLKGVKWAPDGSCVLTASDDNCLRVFDLPQGWVVPELEQRHDSEVVQQQQGGHRCGDGAGTWPCGLLVQAGEMVYDYTWFVGMSANDPASCCFASTCRGQPIKVWDAVSGALRAVYRGYDDVDDPTAATSVAFSLDGTHIVGGYNRCMRVFDVSRPGRDCTRVMTYRKRGEGSLPGIVSCLAFSPVTHDLLAAGSYGRGVALFDARTHEQLLLLEGHRGGVTQVTFSPDGNFLYSGARQDSSLFCWDVRATGQALYSLQRNSSDTNQRIGFSIEPSGRTLATGGCDGRVLVFDLRDGSAVGSWAAANDSCNGVDFAPCMNGLLATASGHRRYPLLPIDGWESSSVDEDNSGGSGSGKDATAAALCVGSWEPGGRCNALCLWRAGTRQDLMAGGNGSSSSVAEVDEARVSHDDKRK